MGVLWDEWFTPPDSKTIKYKIRTVVGNHGYRESDREDLEQRVAIQVWKAMHKHDPKKATRGSFLKTVINNAIASIIEHGLRQKRDRRKEQSPSTDSEDPPDATEEDQGERERRLDIADMVSRLPSDLQAMARLLMENSPAEVARMPGMTRGKVRQQALDIRRYFQEFQQES